MSTGLGLFVPADKGTMTGEGVDPVYPDPPRKPSRHGEVLYNAAGDPVAVVCGSFASNGDEPWNIFGNKVWLAVATAQFRVRGKLTGYDQVYLRQVNPVDVTSWQLAPDNTSADTTDPDGSPGRFVSSLTTEAHMDATLAQDANQDSKRKTDILVVDNSPMFGAEEPENARYCRSLVPIVDGTPTKMDLPRISALLRIYQARDLIDAIDPTAAVYSSNRLQQSTWGKFTGSMSNTSNMGSFVSSSSFLNYAGPAWDVTSAGYLAYAGRIDRTSVVPVLEIPAE